MNTKNSVLTLLMLLLLAACSTQNVKIGWLGPLTGTASTYGVPELNAARLAVDEINNAGGINGKQVELIVEDGKCEAVGTTTAAKKLIEIDQVKYVLGGHCSTETMALMPISEQNKIFIMAGATGTTSFTNAGKYAFRTFPSAQILYSRLAEVAREQGTKTVATLAEQKDWLKSVVGSFATRFEQLGGRIVTRETYEPGTSDFRSQLLKIDSLMPDAVMISVQGPDSAAQIIKQMRELGISQQIYGDALVVNTATFQKTGELLPPTALGALPIADTNNFKTSQLLARYNSRFGEIGTNPFYVTESYDGANIVLSLVTQCGDDVDCARQILLSRTWEGATGNLTFTPDGEPTSFIKIVRIENGTMVFV